MGPHQYSNGGSNNLLVALRRYANCDEENFTTEAFVHLIRHLWQNQHDAALAMLGELTDRKADFSEVACSELEVTTQFAVTPGDVPDIVIRAPCFVVVTEVKVEASLGLNQLDRYRRWLDGENAAEKYLVLLTKRTIDEFTTKKIKELGAVHTRWRDIAQRLRELEPEGFTHELCRYLARQFLEFLRERRMTLEKVSWELADGLRSLISLMEMVDSAVPRGEGIKDVWANQSTISNGFAFKVGITQCWSGVYFEHGNLLVFEARKIDKERAVGAGIGKLEKLEKESWKWVNTLELSSEEVHFFALSSVSQQECIKQFIKEGIDAVRKFTVQ